MFSLIIFEFQIVIQLKSKRLKMPCYGYIGVKKPLINIKGECLFGRAEECDIRIDLPTVSREHAKLKVQVSDGTVNIIALSKTNNVVSLAPMAAQSSCINTTKVCRPLTSLKRDIAAYENMIKQRIYGDKK